MVRQTAIAGGAGKQAGGNGVRGDAVGGGRCDWNWCGLMADALRAFATAFRNSRILEIWNAKVRCPSVPRPAICVFVNHAETNSRVNRCQTSLLQSEKRMLNDEKFARERYYMRKSNEDVFIIDDEEK